jgi:hypothetical protein
MNGGFQEAHGKPGTAGLGSKAERRYLSMP